MKKEDFEFHYHIVKEDNIYFVHVDVFYQVENEEDKKDKLKFTLGTAIDDPRKTISEIEEDAKHKSLDFLKNVVDVLCP